MFNEVKTIINWGDSELTIETGKIARQSDGAVMISMGKSKVLCTAVIAPETKEDIGFFPLTVNYREMAYAAGKIPGGFIKREGKNTDREVLVSRLIDRPIRPLFHKDFLRETHVICTVMSYDVECNPDILSIIGASAALAISGAPYEKIIAASRVGLIDDKFVLNPSINDLKNSKLDLVIAGTDDSIMMVESEADLLSEDQMLEALKFGHESLRPVVQMIDELSNKVSTTKIAPDNELYPSSLKDEINNLKNEEIINAYNILAKKDRTNAFLNLKKDLHKKLVKCENAQFGKAEVEFALNDIKSEIAREKLLSQNKRIDNRSPVDIRQITSEISILPSAHGSSLFTRGETQALVAVTLGNDKDEQIVDSLDEERKESFMLNYIFPPYSVGEVGALRAPTRREIGHGRLSWKALNASMPDKSAFPYSVRLVSEITESNGSSSMATVCGASLALMDAGIPIKFPVAGIAMGLVKKDDKFVVLSDISGDEDCIGDMDFKVAGGIDGITALQMDIKVSGVTFDIMRVALDQAKEGRMSILNSMKSTIESPKSELSKNAPMITQINIDPSKIRDVIGSGGKIIKGICESANAKIDIGNDGLVSIMATGQDNLTMAIDKIKEAAFSLNLGDRFDGKISKILDNGVIVDYSYNQEAFIHISELMHKQIESISDSFKIGDEVKIRATSTSPRTGRTRFTIKDYDKEELPKPYERRGPRRFDQGSSDSRFSRKPQDGNDRGNRSDSRRYKRNGNAVDMDDNFGNTNNGRDTNDRNKRDRTRDQPQGNGNHHVVSSEKKYFH
ncbi:MAG: polyribonucleotide nucleotidyltransferase [Rickettsiaceae bacterium]